jgi:hypothetical protein
MSARCANSQVDTNLIWQFQACKNPAAMSFAVVISKMRSEHNSVSKLSILASKVIYIAMIQYIMVHFSSVLWMSLSNEQPNTKGGVYTY